MTSTLLDATLCLLLVSAATVTVSTSAPTVRPSTSAPTDRPSTVDADATAETLATATATVNYTLAPGARRATGTPVEFPRVGGPAFRRSAHGTLVELLADAAMGCVAVDGRRLTHARDDLAAGVHDAVRAAVGDAHTQVVVVWRPYPGAPVVGRTTVGERPPPDADVRAATVTAASGAPARDSRVGTNGSGFRDVGRRVARRTVTTLFPPDAMRYALGSDYPVSALVRHRYLRAGRLLDVDVTGPVRRHDVTAANRRLAEALATRFARDMRAEFASPAEAAESADVGRVRIVVRRWSA